MRIKLTLQRSEDRATNLTVTADVTATVADVAGALYAGDPGRAGAAVPPRLTLDIAAVGGGPARSLDPSSDLVEAGLRSGSVVTITQASEHFLGRGADRGPAAAVLRVLTGPDAGAEHPLAEGTSYVGRDRDMDVRLGDPQVSKRHARITVKDTVEIVDLNSANGLLLGGQRVAKAILSPLDTVVLGDTTVSVVALRGTANTASDGPVIHFNRSPRVVPRLEEREFPAPQPPRPDKKRKFPIIAMVAPLIMGAVLFAITRSTMTIAFVALSPLIMAGTWLDAKFTGKRELTQSTAEFEASLITSRESIVAAQRVERAVRLARTPSTDEALEAVRTLGPLLWSHRPEHPGFLTVRLGLGAVPSTYTLTMPAQNDTKPEHWAALTALVDDVTFVQDVPIVADLRSVGALGLAGPREQVAEAARAVVVQLAALHSPAELVLAALVSPATRVDWDWLEWLPHTGSPHSPLAGDHLADNSGGGGALLARLEEVVEQRTGGKRAQGAAPRGPMATLERAEPAPPALPAVVLIVEDDAPVDRGRLTRLAERGADVNLHVVWIAATGANLPAVCRAFLLVGGPGEASSAGEVRTGQHTYPVAADHVGIAVAHEIARRLASVEDAGAPVDDDSDLPRTVPYLAMAGVQLADDSSALLERWRESGSIIARDGSAPVSRKTAPTLRALVGIAGHEPLHLDLRTHGPHALVGGTTGAGKSEFLQSWVLGMAAAHSPDRVTFLFVDYKGGAAFADCVALPHTVGLVTDLSPHLVRRALTSLRAELRYREHLLNRKKAKDLASLEKTGDPDAPPSLVIVVDEFAALVKEVPEFVDGVVDVAQRGRSLGMHLILATQRPAGVIKDNLRANTNLRIALRMADEGDSSDILGVPMAAHFDPSIPGRGAVKTGPGRITPFQSAYAGGRTSARPPKPRIDISEMVFGTGVTWEVPEPPADPTEVEAATDIARMVVSIGQAARSARIPSPRKPWLAELAETYDLALLGQRTDTQLALGVVDDAAHQEQRTTFFVPDVDGHLAVFGGGGSGKTVVLRALAAAAGITPRGGPVHVYGLDFAGGGLNMLEDLPHVGAIIDGDDSERVSRLLRWLRDMVDERGGRYSAVRAGTLAEYRELAGNPHEPRILLLVDGFGTFRTEYESTTGLTALYSLFQQLLVDGRAVGIHIAISADRPGAVPTSIAASIQRKIVLRQADDAAYLILGVPKDVLSSSSPPGRAVEATNGLEMQIAVLGGSRNVAEQARAVTRLAQSFPDGEWRRAPGVRRLPEIVPLAGLPIDVRGLPVLGIADDTLEPMGFDPVGTFLIAGPPASGRTNALESVVTSIAHWRPGARIMHVSGRVSPLSGLAVWTRTARGADASAELAKSLIAELSTPPADGELGVVLCIESIGDFLGGPAEASLTEAIKQAKRNGHLVVAEAESSGWTSSWPLLAEVRNGRRGLVLQPEQMEGDLLFRTAFPRLIRAEFPPGRGMFVEAGRARRVQMPHMG
ncbi:FtsK/SpoIIIE domain-containing protein [Pengzhenrongella phosphoraccumulans]|uniref:FtsK/SpoIIIE domain-containing protein n=1 Tax=Pengzhenrongella phosphoraccumulans TaxID=3114394 RepID=UPI003890D80C